MLSYETLRAQNRRDDAFPRPRRVSVKSFLREMNADELEMEVEMEVGRPSLDESSASWQQSDSLGTTGEQPDVVDVTVSSLAWCSTSSRPFTTFYPSRLFTPLPFLQRVTV